MNIKYMYEAYKQAEISNKKNEVPVGAVIVKDDIIISRAHNQQHKSKCATRHAEIIAIEKASKKIGDFRLEECDIYITLEPCAMCAGAIINSRIKNVYYAASDSKSGCFGGLMDFRDHSFNHIPNVEGKILEQESLNLLKTFFKNKRKMRGL